MGHYLADKTYGTNGSCQKEQGGAAYTCNYNYTGRPHIDVEENFNPNLNSDVFKWIPQGLFYDLKDSRNESIPVADMVSGFTNQQMFASFQSTITKLQDYRLKLIEQNISNPTINQVTNLFAQYGY